MSAPLDVWFFVGPLRLQKSNDWWSDQEKSKKTVPQICGGFLHWAQEISQKRCLRHHDLAFPTATGAALDKRTCQEVGGTTAEWDLTLTKEPQKKLFNRRTQQKKKRWTLASNKNDLTNEKKNHQQKWRIPPTKNVENSLLTSKKIEDLHPEKNGGSSPRGALPRLASWKVPKGTGLGPEMEDFMGISWDIQLVGDFNPQKS